MRQAIFALFLGGYAWHRYVIFDAAQADASLFENFIEQRHAGCQVFYNPYLNTFDYGVHLSPAIGPNVAHAIDTLRKNLQPSPREVQIHQLVRRVGRGGGDFCAGKHVSIHGRAIERAGAGSCEFRLLLAPVHRERRSRLAACGAGNRARQSEPRRALLRTQSLSFHLQSRLQAPGLQLQ